MTTPIEELRRMALGDWRVRSIAWSQSGDDLSIGLDPPAGLPGESGKQLTLTFVWTTELEIEMKFGVLSGQALLWDASFEPGPGASGYLVRMDFCGAPEGYIQLACDEVRVDDA